MADKKIISLLPSATEIVCALGLQENLVGRSHECDFPQDIRELPVCTSTRLQAGLNSTQIDQQVKEILEDGLSIYQIDKELIRSLQPDVVITQAQCEVCAVSLKEVEAALQDLLDKEIKIISLEPHGLDDIFQDIRKVAVALNVVERGETLIEEMEERRDIIRHKLKFIDAKPAVACIEWLNPMMLSGNWMPELLEIAGGKSVLAEKGKHSPYVDFEALKAIDPDMMVVMPCGFSIQHTLGEINLLLQLPGWENLAAVKNNQVYIADGNHYFNRSGPRIIDSLEILAEIIHPKQFIFGYEGPGWIKFGI
ncbi:MAG TPA: cobalamin-binding protein [Daejeonella sp.]|nr:cobalamin-binding protein [Daejeonella sp.]